MSKLNARKLDRVKEDGPYHRIAFYTDLRQWDHGMKTPFKAGYRLALEKHTDPKIFEYRPELFDRAGKEAWND